MFDNYAEDNRRFGFRKDVRMPDMCNIDECFDMILVWSDLKMFICTYLICLLLILYCKSFSIAPHMISKFGVGVVFLLG